MKAKNTKRGICFFVIGFLFLAAAGVWFLVNQQEDQKAGKASEVLLQQLDMAVDADWNAEESDISTVTVNGDKFCGKIVIDALGLELPVYDGWSYKRLKKAPCRYSGSVETDDMILLAHNYKHHFGGLKNLSLGEDVCFVDAAGNEHWYAVEEIVTLNGTAVSDMFAGEWDLTLFTCTKGGKARVTVRCDQIENK